MSDSPEQPKAVKDHRWNILRSQLRHQGLLLWILRRVRGGNRV